MRQVTRNIYTINEHPNKEECLEWIRENWHDLGEHFVEDMAGSLEALAEHVQGTLDYRLSIAPDRGEFVRIKDYDKVSLAELYEKRYECPLTGMSYDYNVIAGLYNGTLSDDVTSVLHAEGRYIYSDAGLQDLCETMEYEFYEDGKIA